MKRIAVIGGGYLGAAFAFHAAQLGCTVTVFEQGTIARRASGNSFACLNAFGHSDVEFMRFRLEAIDYLVSLAAELDVSDLLHRQSTVRLSSAETASTIQTKATEFLAAGGKLRELSIADVMKISPEVNLQEVAPPAYQIASEGWVDLVPLTHRLLCHPLITVFENAPVIRSITGEEPGLMLNGRRLGFDAIVLAAGLSTSSLSTLFGTAIELYGSSGIMLRLSKPNIYTERVFYAPGIHFYSLPDGCLLAGIEDSQMSEELSSEAISRRVDICLSRLRKWITDFRYSKFAPILGVRPIPADGYPIVGKVSNEPEVYVLTAHGGATMGALLASILADHIVREREHSWSPRFSPKRFAQSAHNTGPSGGNYV